MPLTASQLQHLEKRLHEERTRLLEQLQDFVGEESSEDSQDLAGDLSKFPTPVSYTHLDVYKRQGLATVTQLPQVGFVGKAVRLAHLFDAGGVQVVQAVGQCGEAGRSRIGGRSGCRKIACRGRFTGPGLRCRR